MEGSEDDDLSISINEDDEYEVNVDIDVDINVKPELGPPTPKELNDEPKELNDEVKINGVSYEDYKSTYKSKANFVQCAFCVKFFCQEKNGFITVNDEGENICYHCLFWVNYSLEQRSTVDGVFGKTIHDYVLQCAETHNTETCTRRGECFVCDYLDGIIIENIFGSEELYSVWKSERNVDNDDLKIVITI
jgi:hypothetical protein